MGNMSGKRMIPIKERIFLFEFQGCNWGRKHAVMFLIFFTHLSVIFTDRVSKTNEHALSNEVF